MAEDASGDEVEARSINRRNVLKATAGSAVALTGLAAFGGKAAAWRRNDADFRGCSEVWVIIDPDDLGEDDENTPSALVIKVVVATGDGTACREFDLKEEELQTIPGQYGDAPLFKYSVSDPEKILGVVFYNPPEMVPTCVAVNDHRCAENAPSVFSAECTSGLSEEDICDGTSSTNGNGPNPRGRRNG